MTKITFLGTGGDNYIISKGIRNSGGIILQHDELQFHIDPGPNSLLLAKNNDINPRATTAIICTSPKISHCNDINIMISAMTYNGVDVKGVVVGTETIVKGNQGNFPILHSFFRNCVERVIISEPGKKIGIENVDIYFLETTDYCDTVGMKMLFPDITLGYSSDTSYSEKVAKQYEGCDILILNVPNPTGVKKKYQMSTDDAIKFISKIKPQLAILTHFGKGMLEEDPLVEARNVHNKTGCQVMAAVDGQSISPTSYSAKSKQKKLKGFD
jgi:ribonuclease BN (tRNA processing enzyme)